MRRVRVGVFLGALLLLLLQASPQAVGTVTITTTLLSDVKVVKYSLAWVSDASGAVSGNPATLRMGSVIQIKYIPDGGGTAPTALYDVTLVDVHGIDFLAGGGANLSATASTLVRQTTPLFHDGTSTLDLVVANAGVSKGGTVQLWIQQ
jgi:hypothetical protein